MQLSEAMGIKATRALGVAALSEAYLLAGRRDEALPLAGRALACSSDLKQHGHQAWILRLLGEIAAHRHPVWPKYSCGLALVVFQQPAKPLTTLQRACTCRVLTDRRKEQHIVLALMIALVMIVLLVLVDRMPEGGFTKQNQR